MKYNFTNKTIWITGASAGIGEAIALAFAQRGAQLILSARNKAQLDRVAEKCQKAGAGKTIVLAFDLTQTAMLPDIYSKAIDSMASIDILVNNGGISQRGTVNETHIDVYKKLMETNFFGAVSLTKAVLPAMIAQKSGKIVIISSIAGKIGTRQRSGYAAAKHALHGFFDSLRAEVSNDNIGVLLVCPGYVRTNVSMNALDASGNASGKMDKNQELGMPPEMLAEKIIYAITKNKKEIYVGGKEVLGVYIKRFFPGLLAKIVSKRVDA